MSAYRWRYLSSPGNYPATVRAARRRLALLELRRSLGTVKTIEVPTGYPYTSERATVRAGVVGAVR